MMQSLKDIMEIVYFLSGPVIACIAYRALAQISEAKKQVAETKEGRILSAKRDSYKIAADKCEYFMSTITPLIDSLNDALEEDSVKPLDDTMVSFEDDYVKVKSDFDKEIFSRIIFDYKGLHLFNLLESFSLFFTSGVAEDEIGFLTIGHSFCSPVKEYLPVIALLSSDGGHFQNVLNLYKIWNDRIEKDTLEQEKKKIENKLNQKKDIKINSIGTR